MAWQQMIIKFAKECGNGILTDLEKYTFMMAILVQRAVEKIAINSAEIAIFINQAQELQDTKSVRYWCFLEAGKSRLEYYKSQKTTIDILHTQSLEFLHLACTGIARPSEYGALTQEYWMTNPISDLTSSTVRMCGSNIIHALKCHVEAFEYSVGCPDENTSEYSEYIASIACGEEREFQHRFLETYL